MRRREVIALVGHATAAPFLGSGSLHAQMPERMRNIGVLKYTGESDQTSKAGAQAFEEELARLGWKKGAAVRIDYRFGDGDAGRTAALAKELVALAPDAIVSRGTPATHTLLHETRTVPIVFVSVSDPVGDRFVNSIARPGGNITGFTNLEAGVAGKWLELLKEVAPNTRRVAALFNPDVATAGGTFYLRAIADAASSFGVSVEAMRGSHGWRDRVRPRSTCTHSRRRPHRHARSFCRRTPRADNGPRRGSPAACGLRLPQHGGGRRADVLRGRPHRLRPALGRLCQSHLEGHPAWRAARAGADQVRARHQSQDRVGPRPRNPAYAPRPCRRGDRMRRGQFVCGAGASLLVSGARAQPSPARVPRVGILTAARPEQRPTPLSAFLSGLSELGYTDGRNIVLEFRFAAGDYSV